MKWRSIILCVAACWGSAAGQSAQAETQVDCDALYEDVPHGRILDLLDPTADARRRADVLLAYERLSEEKECPEFGYTLGQLYRHGADLPGHLVERDIPKAQELIRTMAEDGYLPAFADLAEMVMRHGEPREAMQWTQVYLHFSKTVQRPHLKDADAAQFHRSAYNGHLLTRAEVVWTWPKRALPRRYVREDLNAYLEAHGEAVEKRIRERMAGVSARASAQDGVGMRLLGDAGDCRLNVRDRIGAATASWIVEVLPSGQKGRMLLENFVPTTAMADRLRQQCLVRYEFAPFDGEQSRTARISVVFGSTEGAALRR